MDNQVFFTIAGACLFFGAVVGWIACLGYKKGCEIRAANEAWRQATTFHTYKDNQQATRL